mmetsp:Transcript_8645/g.14897  ORF Transcript_8645/g.14897 Transcript_8645/m.14897 type:complete len:193 (-) Transcript_8645:309-887(-)|eukprot:CAMPEP_0119107776 /NCGR_PEP_ID=MMETSP1180-20130426/11597_1 /TAXON_ID=3052 ORGANISM="Chlamydomonas cf sp, Strain CCMP681" /NCGR_SAMPLE_ID=MMETSP1180 /ASSEMBLY_ACC=CAM_ASM_000741 /LENGTH=192 /DNA_ID=CAMNT_0007093313 /DNA_START=107 /DNA_END=685 /DNA_ORIENTATION=-
MAAPAPAKNLFLAKHKEKEDFNQYWYSQHTIEHIVKELLVSTKACAFLSTPSIYFSLPKDSQLRGASWVFDFDEQWSKDSHFCMYDFNKPEEIPAKLHGQFDCVVIDPPFITHEVWTKYAAAAKLLLSPGGKVVASTVPENAELLFTLLGAKPCLFKPSIPHLVYQYCLFLNFEPSADGLGQRNHMEIPEDD